MMLTPSYYEAAKVAHQVARQNEWLVGESASGGEQDGCIHVFRMNSKHGCGNFLISAYNGGILANADERAAVTQRAMRQTGSA